MDFIKPNYEWVVTGKSYKGDYDFKQSLVFHGSDIFNALDKAVDFGMYDITGIEMTGVVK